MSAMTIHAHDLISSPAGWLRRRHSLAAEVAGVVVLYALYEGSRGLAAGDPAEAVDHAQSIVSIERSLHVFVEADIQRGVGEIPGLIGTLGALYLTLHLLVTGACLLWLHRRRPGAYAQARTALVIASGFALVGYLAFPAAPPRLAGLGITDTISKGHVDLNHGLVSSLYNPFAAFPSVHITYAVIVAACVVRNARHLAVRMVGAAYPVLVLLVIVSTGNHFLLDAAGGLVVALLALRLAGATRTRSSRVRFSTLAEA
jgi:hypothetical protein